MLIQFDKVVSNWRKNPFTSLLSKRISGEIDEKEFDKENAYGALDTLKDLKYLSLPEKPRILEDYQRAKEQPGWVRQTLEVRSTVVKRCFDNVDVKKYLYNLSHAEHQNNSNYYWLKKYYIALSEDKICRKRVMDVLKTYPGFFYRSSPEDSDGSARDLRSLPKPGDGSASQVTEYENK